MIASAYAYQDKRAAWEFALDMVKFEHYNERKGKRLENGQRNISTTYRFEEFSFSGAAFLFCEALVVAVMAYKHSLISFTILFHWTVLSS